MGERFMRDLDDRGGQAHEREDLVLVRPVLFVEEPLLDLVLGVEPLDPGTELRPEFVQDRRRLLDRGQENEVVAVDVGEEAGGSRGLGELLDQVLHEPDDFVPFLGPVVVVERAEVVDVHGDQADRIAAAQAREYLLFELGMAGERSDGMGGVPRAEMFGHAVDAGADLLRLEGFAEVIVRRQADARDGLEPGAGGLRSGQGGGPLVDQHEDGRLARAGESRERPGRVRALRPGQERFQDHQPDRGPVLLARRFDRFLPASAEDGFETFRGARGPYHLADGRVFAGRYDGLPFFGHGTHCNKFYSSGPM